jgi:hypothetical protein
MNSFLLCGLLRYSPYEWAIFVKRSLFETKVMVVNDIFCISLPSFAQNQTYVTSTIYKTATLTSVVRVQKYMEKKILNACPCLFKRVLSTECTERRTILEITGIRWKCVKISLVVIVEYCSDSHICPCTTQSESASFQCFFFLLYFTTCFGLT